MREADLKEYLTATFRRIMDGVASIGGLMQQVRALESDKKFRHVIEVLLSFGRFIEIVQMLRSLDVVTVAMDREVQAVSQELVRELCSVDVMLAACEP